MLGPNDLPFAVVGERCLILESAPKDRTIGGLHVPENAKERYYSGKLLDAGLAAKDKLYDAGIEIGDVVEFGRYSGLREAWDRIIEGTHGLADGKYDWKYSPDDCINGVREAWRCTKTKALRVVDSVIVLNVDDIIASRELAERIRVGKVRARRGKTAEGETQHHIERSE